MKVAMKYSNENLVYSSSLLYHLSFTEHREGLFVLE